MRKYQLICSRALALAALTWPVLAGTGRVVALAAGDSAHHQAASGGTVPSSGSSEGVIVPGTGSMARETVSTTFSVAGLRAENAAAPVSYNFLKRGLLHVHPGHRVRFVLYFTVQSAPPGSRAVVTISIVHGVGVQLFRQITVPLLSVANTYRVALPYMPREAGTLVARATVTIDGLTQQITHTLRVQPAPAAARVSQPAPSALRSGRFALPLTSFPAGSVLRLSEAASNDVAGHTAIPHLTALSFSQEGRIGGWYVDSLQANHGHPVYTAYLTSIFGTVAQAHAAFSLQRQGYARLTRTMPHNFRALRSTQSVGEVDAMYETRTAIGGHVLITRELFFVRKRVLVEVVQSYFANDMAYGAKAESAMYRIAAALDTRSA